ncbi:MAG: outer membrane beta-barrel protein [Proteobacteria bacterium]|nr:outer membrane beta-barrel protein [Pseudomonadota bacterium]
MRYISAAVMAGVMISGVASSAQAKPYLKVDLGLNDIRTKIPGEIDGVTIDHKAHRPRGGLVGLGVGSQLGDYRIELMVNGSRNHRTIKISSDEMRLRLHRISGMVNVYYDRYLGIVSPYAMAGFGTVFHKARIKHYGGSTFHLRNVRGIIGQGGTGLMVRLTESVSLDVGLRVGMEKFTKGKNVTTVAPDTIHAKYGIFSSIITGLQVSL